MHIVTDTKHTPTQLQHAVIALGNFDGLHKGHQVVLGRAKEIAKASGKPFGVMTFEPHPRSLFCPNDPPYRITPPQLKRHLLEAMGVDVLFDIPFTREFSHVSAQDFINALLLDGAQLSHGVAGHDFVFGYKRGGDVKLLREMLAARGVGCTEISPVVDSQNHIWSSTRVRAHIEKGEMREAAFILGRPFMVEADVGRGDQQGRTLGFPTANMEMGQSIRPRYGVYAVRVQLEGKMYKGVANIGIRPTFAGRKEQLEAHLFDFTGDIYGKTLIVEFIDFIRSEQPFSSPEALKNQISKDCVAAKAILI